MEESKKMFMERAIRLSRESVERGGGPFGAVIVRGGKVIAEGSNNVTVGCDPTAHAEVTAIRNAAQNLKNFDLSGCEIYTSCEPCPMCLGAIYWARLEKIYYAGDRQDAKEAGFDDSFIYDEIPLAPDQRSIRMERLLGDEARDVFDGWIAKADKVEY